MVLDPSAVRPFAAGWCVAFLVVAACAEGGGRGSSGNEGGATQGGGGVGADGGGASGAGTTGGGGSGTGGDCTPSYHQSIVDSVQPTNTTGTGIAGTWSYMSNVGLAGGEAMCDATGGDHVCTYFELIKLSNSGGLSTVTSGQTIWIVGQTDDCDGWTVSGVGSDGAYSTVTAGTLTAVQAAACNATRAIPCCKPCL